MVRAIRLLLLGLALAVAAPARTVQAAGSEQPRTHTVYKGQRLGSIAKRYNVSVDALCNANGISSTDPIQPGQKLVIPGPNDKDGSQARRHAAKPRATTSTKSGSTGGSTGTRQHKVYPGHTLGKIAKRYNVSIDALCHANDMRRTDPIKAGQELIIPTADDPDGKHARGLRASGYLEKRSTKPEKSATRATAKTATKQAKSTSWRDYQKPPWRRGYITLVGYHETWKGYVIGPGNKVLPGARQAVSQVMGASGDRPRADWRLVRLLAKVSDTFGGRPIRVVSGYRTESYSLNSRHKKSQAIDFSIPGVPNTALRDYLLTFANVGVGYYPNSSFVHFDVRDKKTYWVDVSGPGEAPRYVR